MMGLSRFSWRVEEESDHVRILFLFLDGVGLGETDPERNPLMAARLPTLHQMIGGIPSLRQRRISSPYGAAVPIDATLGVDGLPQSGTGQAALLAGFNAPKVAGHHFGPFPPSSIREQIRKQNIFQMVLELGKSPCFANAFPQRFFDYVAAHKFRMSMTTLSCLYSGLALRKAPELKSGHALSADLTNEGWQAMGYPDIPIRTPKESGHALADLAMRHEFTLFEYWTTDSAGHSRDRTKSIAVLERFDAMLEGLLERLDEKSTLILMSSDHGNIEDLSVKTHTRNPVPLVAYGHGYHAFLDLLSRRHRPNLSHITPAMLELLKANS